MRADRWRELLAAGRLLEGLRAAERANFDAGLSDRRPRKELLALADAGRFFGPSRRAVAALGCLATALSRARRTPGRRPSRWGASCSRRSTPTRQAANWFETYLREQPSGPLMGDAFGRLMEARLRSGDGAGARASAEQYLRRFPEGPYASEARGILSR